MIRKKSKNSVNILDQQCHKLPERQGKNEKTFMLCVPMKIVKLFLRVITVAITTSALPNLALAQGRDLSAEVNSIKSIAQVKQNISALLANRDQCGVGSCFNGTSTAICEQVGMLDVRVNGKIFSGATGWTDSVLPISKSDLDLMKLIFSQCKPTNYQYWNWGLMLHVWYNPSCQDDQKIRTGLGMSRQSKACQR